MVPITLIAFGFSLSRAAAENILRAESSTKLKANAMPLCIGFGDAAPLIPNDTGGTL